MSDLLKPGLYEQVINENIDEELKSINPSLVARENIDEAEASSVLSRYLSEILQKGLDNVADNTAAEEKEKNNKTSKKLSRQIELVNDIVSLIKEKTGEDDFSKLKLPSSAEQLMALLDKNNPEGLFNQKAEDVLRPQTSIAATSLFTGAAKEPQMYEEIRAEIKSSDRIDMLVSFIRWSGLRLILDELKDFTLHGGELRIITTSYMGATDLKAIEELSSLPNTRIKVSYDTRNTRLHAKTYIFVRNTGFTTAYVGSSNMSNAAMTRGLEWNVKITRKDLPETMNKIEATFESYWRAKEFESYDNTRDQKTRLSQALSSEKYSDSEGFYPLEVTPYYYQNDILDRLDAERKVHGFYRNLLVAATGTGKTVISAFDYRRFRNEHPGKPCRLLFVAHREEIIKQSLYTFRAILKDPNFGNILDGHHKPDEINHLFVTIQSFNSQELTAKTPEYFYDYIIIDEFHHAAAASYRKLLAYYQPEILLGLTATPERMDGQDILPFFSNRIAAEIRLHEAIEKNLLSPFQYFGVSDTADLDKIVWSRGGYDKKALSELYTIDRLCAERRADLIYNSVLKYVTDIKDVKGLGFCVSVEHAEFMTKQFTERGIPCECVTGQTPAEIRSSVKSRLVSGVIKFIFTVDVYNEGVDIPEINTVLFLRPTESLTIFLQQLGRGLRLAEKKECLTVLDFIGQANKKYRFAEKFNALLSGENGSLEKQIRKGFTGLPRGCYIKLEKQAAEYVLNNIKNAYGNRRAVISLISGFEEDTGRVLSLSSFLDYYNITAKELYKSGASFSRFCVTAGVRNDFIEKDEMVISKALQRIAELDSVKLIKFLLKIIPHLEAVDFNSMSEVEKRMLRMFSVILFKEAYESFTPENSVKLRGLAENPVMLAELTELLKYRLNKIDFVSEAVLGTDIPLELHCSYTRDQILTALDFYGFSKVREGVKYLEDKKLDILFITLNKSDKDYSPTTMYRDYSLNEEFFHWQSQSTTSAASKTGERYIHHRERDSKVILFVREYKNDRVTGLASAYTCLGTASYVEHKGSKPMNIIWKLDKPIPGKYIAKTNKLIAG